MAKPLNKRVKQAGPNYMDSQLQGSLAYQYMVEVPEVDETDFGILSFDLGSDF